MKKVQDITGKRFGKLLVIKSTGKRNRENKLFWLCKCDCGRDKITIAKTLKAGLCKTCGCRLNSEAIGGIKNKRPMGYKKEVLKAIFI